MDAAAHAIGHCHVKYDHEYLNIYKCAKWLNACNEDPLKTPCHRFEQK